MDSKLSLATPPDYVVLVSTSDDYLSGFHVFAEKVNRKLRAGYRLHGAPFNINQTLCQAMILVDDPQVGGSSGTFSYEPKPSPYF